MGRPGTDIIVDHGTSFCGIVTATPTRRALLGLGYDGPSVPTKRAGDHAFVVLATSGTKVVGVPGADRLLADIPTIVYSSGSGKSNTGLLRRNSTVSGSPLIATAVRTNILIGSLMAAVEATNDSMYLHGGTNCQLDNWQSCGCKRLALS
jgi:mannose/cellobiose epimerase-like protein (N-acyl-D-glucosamine 2-epimerase family)